MEQSQNNPDTYFDQIWNDKIDEVDISCLQKICKSDYYGYTPQGILADSIQGAKQLWRGKHKGKRFLVVTEVRVHPAGKELDIWGAGGEGYFSAYPVVIEKLTLWGRERNCRWISARTQRPGIIRLAQSQGGKTTWQNLVLEI